MTDQAPLKETPGGLEPAGEGWFVANVRVMTRRDVNVEELARRDEPTSIPDTPSSN